MQKPTSIDGLPAEMWQSARLLTLSDDHNKRYKFDPSEAILYGKEQVPA
jgi:hypothetical protein